MRLRVAYPQYAAVCNGRGVQPSRSPARPGAWDGCKRACLDDGCSSRCTGALHGTDGSGRRRRRRLPITTRSTSGGPCQTQQQREHEGVSHSHRNARPRAANHGNGILPRIAGRRPQATGHRATTWAGHRAGHRAGRRAGVPEQPKPLARGAHRRPHSGLSAAPSLADWAITAGVGN